MVASACYSRVVCEHALSSATGKGRPTSISEWELGCLRMYSRTDLRKWNSWASEPNSSLQTWAHHRATTNGRCRTATLAEITTRISRSTSLLSAVICRRSIQQSCDLQTAYRLGDEHTVDILIAHAELAQSEEEDAGSNERTYTSGADRAEGNSSHSPGSQLPAAENAEQRSSRTMSRGSVYNGTAHKSLRGPWCSPGRDAS